MVSIAIDRVSEHHFISSWLRAGNDAGKLLVVDLGMNAGEFSREMLRRYSKSRVVAVEANPRLASAAESRSNLDCYNYAIAPANGPVTFGIDPDDSTASSLHAMGGNSEKVVVEGIRFFDFMQRARIEDEVIDLELFEQAPARCFANVRQICVEFHAFIDPKHLPRIAKIIARMESLGFHCIDFTTNYQDVLMVNKRLGLSRLGPIEMMKMSLTKYVRGAKRKFAKLV
jgi:FkbM family methyltransferase